jgi:NAD(P)-dependent dehydrogenase (short-subunit alcohol dehydrogenase family)
MSEKLSFQDRVAIVTGAGGGLGRSHALLLAQRGAKVVVNDLGGDRAGRSGGSASMADAVVEEIRNLGGTAVADHHSVDTVEGAEGIVATAIDTFGRVDVLVNNAGILRDASFAKMAPEDFRSVLRVHLEGTVNVSRAVWPHMRAAGYGRIINTTSGAGLYGNFGQTNYSAAKAGIVGFSRTLAVEGAPKNILVNVIAPLAASRLTEDVMSEELFKKFEPEYVSALVAFLANEVCTLHGQIFELGGGYYARVALIESEGIVVDSIPSPEELADRIDEISDISTFLEPARADVLLAKVNQKLGL